MAQLVPSVLFHAQAIKIIEELRTAYATGVATSDDLVKQLREAITNFENTVGMPFFDFEPVVEGEPPLTAKINRLWSNLMHDINILEQQADISKASTIFTHNMIATEVLKAQRANARVANKLKTLQLYSKSSDSSIVVFGDHFRSTDFMDLTVVPEDQRPTLRGEGYVVLGQDGDLWDLGDQSGIRILDSSNGFLGNLHEITADPREVTFTRNATGTYTTSVSTAGTTVHTISSDGLVKDLEPVFKAETDSRRDLTTVTDGAPDTWAEYECWKVADVDRTVAKNFNFTYAKRSLSAEGEEKVEYVDWAAGPPDGVLKLGLEFDLGMTQNVNYITYVPFNLDDNDNHPVKVTKVQTSTDRTNWEPVRPRDLVVGSTTNLQSGGATDVVGDGIWAFSGRRMRYVQMYIEQSQSVSRKMGHLYYEVEKRVGETKTGQYTTGVYEIERIEGPAPAIEDPTFYYDPSIRRVKHAEGAVSAVQRRETFTAQRWAIGIRDVRIQQVNHMPSSTIVTKRLRVGGIVDRVILDADMTVPPEYDGASGWVLFWISPNDGAQWFPISRVQDDYLGIPEVVAFNDPLPEDLREPGVGYYTTTYPVTTLRLKIVIQRPGNLPSTTPVLHSYQLKVKTKKAT